MFKTLKIRLITVFIGFSLLGLIIIVLNNRYDKKKNSINNILSKLNSAQITHLNNQKIFRDYLYIDTRNSNYFSTEKSVYLQKHDSIFKDTQKKINSLLSNPYTKTLKVQKQLNNINKGLDTFYLVTNEIAKDYILKGFKDFGNTGEMRKHAHNLEKIKTFPKEHILMMRRHEKDFIIRGEKKYSNRFFEKYEKYRQEILNSNNINKAVIITELDAYKDNFKKLIMYTNLIGEKNNTGLFNKLNRKTQQLQIEFVKIKETAENIQKAYFKNLRTIYVFILFILLAISILAGIFVANKITRPISILGSRMNLFIKSDFSLTENFKYKTKIPEIKKLIENYFLLKKETLSLVNNLNSKVDERTKELTKQTLQIETQNKELKKQTKALRKINENIYSGLNYAKHIQNSLLPTKKHIKNHFSDLFLIYKPKDIVSGDFYWSNRFINVEGMDLSVFVVADSTGHGIAGALMSMLGVTFLNEITPRNDITHASDVLTVLRDSINKTLRKNDNITKSSNGMDIGIFILNNKTLRLEFSGANSKLYIVRDEELITLKGDKMSIGINYSKEAYSDYDIDLEKGDTVYLTTDGYYDQFGGNEDRKFLKKNFKRLITKIAHMTSKEQEEILIETLDNWKGNNEQTDDILVCGVKI